MHFRPKFRQLLSLEIAEEGALPRLKKMVRTVEVFKTLCHKPISSQGVNFLSHDLSETLERIRITSKTSQMEWCDLLGIHWSDYLRLKSGHSVIETRSLENLARKFGLPVEQIVFGKLDFREFSRKLESEDADLPERYSKAAFGRRRSSITSIDFLEDQVGWRLRTDVLQKFEIPESQLLNPFAPISVLFITDLCAYLHRRGFRQDHLMAMGAYGYKNNSKTLIGKYFSSLKNPGEVYESFFTEGMKFFEQNCTYTLTKLTPTGGVFEVHSNSDVAQELGVRHVGSHLLCAFKAGLAASMPLHLGLPMAQVRETACVHHGDRCCEFEFTYQQATA